MITGQDFLKLAETWIASSAEAEWRSAVSRAYYAAFHVARILLRNLGFQVPRGDRAHAYLWLRLSNCGDSGIRRAGSDLSSLRGDRNRADYDVEQTLAHADGLLQVGAAAKIIQILDSANAEPLRTTVRDAMRAYERDVLHDVTWRP